MDQILPSFALMDETDLDFPALMDESMEYDNFLKKRRQPIVLHVTDKRGEFWWEVIITLLDFPWSKLQLRSWPGLRVYSLHSKNGTVTIGGVRLPNQGPHKCIMVGGGGTGKTTYVKRHLTGEFEKKYEPTMGMHEHMLDVPTKQGSTRFLCVDTPGHEKPGTPRDSYFEGADCGIIFCDITAKQTQMDVPMWHDDLCRVCGDIPIVVCGNKMDLKRRQVKTKKVPFHVKKKLQYYEISAKSGYNLDKPFQYLAEKLAGYVEGANCI